MITSKIAKLHNQSSNLRERSNSPKVAMTARWIVVLVLLQFVPLLAFAILDSTALNNGWKYPAICGCVAIQCGVLVTIYRLRRSLNFDSTQQPSQAERLLHEPEPAVIEQIQRLASNNEFMKEIIEAQVAEIAVIDEHGQIRHSNQAWDTFWSNNQLSTDEYCDKDDVQICDLAFENRDGIDTVTSPTIERVLSGQSQFESLTYGCVLSGEKRWFKIEITPFSNPSIHAVVIQREITSHYLAERTLTEANRWNNQLASAVSKTHSAIVFTDRNRRITWVNSGFERITGYTIEEVRGKKPGDMLQCENTNPQTVLEIRAALNRGLPFRGNIQNVSKDGREYWLDLEIHPMFDADGDMEGFMSVENDVTELVEALLSAKNALNEVNALRNALDHHSLLSVTDTDGTILDVNSGFCQLSGYTRDELLGENHRILNSGHHPHSFWKEMWDKVTNGDPWRGEIKNRAKDGSFYWLDETIIPQIGTDGKPESFMSLQFDITDKKVTEESLAKANKQHRLIASAIERSPDVSVVTDLEGTVLFANPAAYHLDAQFGYDLAIGSPALLFTSDRLNSEILNRLVETVRNGSVFSENFEIIPNQDNQLFEFAGHRIHRPLKVLSVTASPLENSIGEVDGIFLAKRDITDETARQKSLE